MRSDDALVTMQIALKWLLQNSAQTGPQQAAHLHCCNGLHQLAAICTTILVMLCGINMSKQVSQAVALHWFESYC